MKRVGFLNKRVRRCPWFVHVSLTRSFIVFSQLSGWIEVTYLRVQTSSEVVQRRAYRSSWQATKERPHICFRWEQMAVVKPTIVPTLWNKNVILVWVVWVSNNNNPRTWLKWIWALNGIKRNHWCFGKKVRKVLERN